MAAYKTVDFFLQGILVIILLSMYLFGGEDINSFPLLLIFGLVQAISIILHLLAGPQPWKSRLRRIHHIGTVIVIVAVIIAFLAPNFSDEDFAGLGILIYVSIPAALLALFYTVITFIEWQKIRKPE